MEVLWWDDWCDLIFARLRKLRAYLFHCCTWNLKLLTFRQKTPGHLPLRWFRGVWVETSPSSNLKRSIFKSSTACNWESMMQMEPVRNPSEVITDDWQRPTWKWQNLKLQHTLFKFQRVVKPRLSITETMLKPWLNHPLESETPKKKTMFPFQNLAMRRPSAKNAPTFWRISIMFTQKIGSQIPLNESPFSSNFPSPSRRLSNVGSSPTQNHCCWDYAVPLDTYLVWEPLDLEKKTPQISLSKPHRGSTVPYHKELHQDNNWDRSLWKRLATLT